MPTSGIIRSLILTRPDTSGSVRSSPPAQARVALVIRITTVSCRSGIKKRSLLGRRWTARKAGEMDADEGTAGKADLGAVESSQNTLTEDDPDTIPSEGNSANCGISVSFKSGMYFSTEGQSLPNGPSTIRLNGQDNFRL